MPDIPLLNPITRWECPNCDQKLVVNSHSPHSPFHPCAGLKGMQAPMVLEGTDCDIRANVREDYVGEEDVTYDENGRPIMAVETRYADGRNDLAVMAPCINMTTPVE